MKRKVTTLVMVMSLVASTTSLTGCFGSFQLTQGIYGWNKSVSSNKFIQWFVFLLLTIVPVYVLGGVVDVFVFNSLEFWTGSNPVANGDTAPATRTVMLDEKTQLHMVRLDETRMSATVTQPDSAPQTFVLIFNETGMEMRDADGGLIAEIKDTEGLLEVLNATGEPVAAYDEQDASDLTAAYEFDGAKGATDFAMKRWGNAPNVASR